MEHNQTVKHLNWLLNTNPKNPFYKVGVYDSKSFIITQVQHGLIFEHEILETLNKAGFNLYCIGTNNDFMFLVVQDRRVNG